METFDYMETYQPPPGEGYTRYASATLTRSPDRIYWVYDEHKWVMDDFGFLQPAELLVCDLDEAGTATITRADDLDLEGWLAVYRQTKFLRI